MQGARADLIDAAGFVASTTPAADRGGVVWGAAWMTIQS